MHNITLLILSSLITSYLSKILYQAYLGPLSRIPAAHVTAPFSRIWLLRHKYRRSENQARLMAHRRLGPVIRIGPKELSINCMEHGVQTVYGSSFEKDVWYEKAFRGDTTPYMFTTVSTTAHSERKRLLASSYSKSSITSSRRLAKICKRIVAGRFENALSMHAKEGHAIDVMTLNKACLMDLTTAWLFGLKVGTEFLIDSSSALQFFSALIIGSKGFFWRSEFYHLTKALLWLRIPILSNAVYRSRGMIRDWSAKICAAAYDVMVEKQQQPISMKHEPENECPGYPFIYATLRRGLEQSQMQGHQTEAALQAELLDHVVASHDVTGITLTYLQWELSKNQALQARLRDELLTHELNTNVANSPCDSSDLTKARELDLLPLLNAVVLETLRVHSANPGPWPRVTPTTKSGSEPPTGVQIGTFANIPSGTIVSASSWTLHKNADIYADPEEWLPDRWLNPDSSHDHQHEVDVLNPSIDGSPLQPSQQQRMKEMIKWFWPFGSGSRMCIGNHFAVRAMKEIVAQIYTKYQTELVDGYGNASMEHIDGVIAGPVGGKLFLRLKAIHEDSK